MYNVLSMESNMIQIFQLLLQSPDEFFQISKPMSPFVQMSNSSAETVNA